MRVIGVDPGLRNTGWGIIERRDGGRLSYIACGTIQTATGDLAPRLLLLAQGLRHVMDAYQPDVASVEKTFVNRDPAGALKLGHARAIALLIPAEAGLPVFEYAPNEVKKTVVGVGHAGKEQVTRMVEILLPGAKPKTSDAADALAIAICHVQHSQLASRIGI
jgi:crossover junction endodeoxyribonuclease RuvC